MRVEIGIPTKNRPRVLGRCLAALLSQTYQNWDLTIIDDSDKYMAFDPITQHWIDVAVKNGHRVNIVPNKGGGQAWAHNYVLYNTQHAAILRLDDDLILNPDALWHLVWYLATPWEEYGYGIVAAVGGLWFPGDFITPRRSGKPRAREWLDEAKAVPTWEAQVVYLPNPASFEVDHLYSTCLYRTEVMKAVGGWPQVYRGVGYREDTDGTHKLHLAGWKLLVAPVVTGQHLFAAGGCRTDPDWEQRCKADFATWDHRLPRLRAINFKRRLSVLVYSAHGDVVGGAERLLMRVINVLQSDPGLDVYPCFLKPDSLILTPEKCQEIFGFSYDDRAEDEWPESFDVGICLDHRAPLPPKPCRAVLGYSLFPIYTETVHHIAHFLAISQFTADHIKTRWGREAEVLYPPVTMCPPALDKKKVVLWVGHLSPDKHPLLAIEAFRKARLKVAGWKLHLVGTALPTRKGYLKHYEEWVQAEARNDTSIILHQNISQAELNRLYGEAKILLACRGYEATQPELQEHFGYTVVEAIAAGCVPLVYDAGGYRETCPISFLRWETARELTRNLRYLAINSDGVWEKMLQKLREYPFPYNLEEFGERLRRRVRQVGYLALDDRPYTVQVKDRSLKVGIISDHPGLPTGWGITTRMVGLGLVGAGHEVSFLGGGGAPIHNPHFRSGASWRVWAAGPADPDGGSIMSDWLRTEQPDVVLIIRDIGGVGGYLRAVRALFQGPVVGYFPLEGTPLWAPHGDIIRHLDRAVTWLPFAQEEIERVTGLKVEFLPPGADHADFRPLDEEARQELREQVGFSDHFVVGQVARNRRVKAPWRLLKALRILLDSGMDDVLLYLHMAAEEGGMWEGFDLADMVKRLGLTQHVVFAPDLQPPMVELLAEYCPELRAKFRQWVQYDAGRTVFVSNDLDPEFKAMLHMVSLSLVERYNVLDMAILPSEVEGAGLPILEAMACGTPVAVTNDQGRAMSSLAGNAAILMGARLDGVRCTGVDLHCVSPVTIATTIIKVRQDGQVLADLRELGPARAAQFKWGPTTKRLAEIVEETWYLWHHQTEKKTQ